MMNWLVKWGVKKWLVGVVDNALAKYNVNIDRARAIVATAIAKIEAVIAFLKSLDGKLADGKLTEEEADEIVAEAKKLAGELTA
jgi:hypothetical protein